MWENVKKKNVSARQIQGTKRWVRTVNKENFDTQCILNRELVQPPAAILFSYTQTHTGTVKNVKIPE